MRKLAVALDSVGQIAEDLSSTEQFFVYEIQGDHVSNKETQNSYGVEVDAKIAFIKNEDIGTLFIKNISDIEVDSFGRYDLEIFINCDDSADEIIARYLAGDLEQDTDTTNIEETMKMENEREYVAPPINASILTPEIPTHLMAFELAEDQLDQAGRQRFGYESEYETARETWEEEIKDAKNDK